MVEVHRARPCVLRSRGCGRATGPRPGCSRGRCGRTRGGPRAAAATNDPVCATTRVVASSGWPRAQTSAPAPRAEHVAAVPDAPRQDPIGGRAEPDRDHHDRPAVTRSRRRDAACTAYGARRRRGRAGTWEWSLPQRRGGAADPRADAGDLRQRQSPITVLEAVRGRSRSRPTSRRVRSAGRSGGGHLEEHESRPEHDRRHDGALVVPGRAHGRARDHAGDEPHGRVAHDAPAALGDHGALLGGRDARACSGRHRRRR